MELALVVSWIGLLAGTAGVCFSLYLELMSSRHVKWHHTLSFFLVGSFLMLTYSYPLTNDHAVSIVLQLLAIVGVAVCEILGFVWVLDKAPESGEPTTDQHAG
jgi:hypothetical protein